MIALDPDRRPDVDELEERGLEAGGAVGSVTA